MNGYAVLCPPRHQSCHGQPGLLMSGARPGGAHGNPGDASLRHRDDGAGGHSRERLYRVRSHREIGGFWMWPLNPRFDIRLHGNLAFAGEGYNDLAHLADCAPSIPGVRSCRGATPALTAEARFRVRFYAPVLVLIQGEAGSPGSLPSHCPYTSHLWWCPSCCPAHPPRTQGYSRPRSSCQASCFQRLRVSVGACPVR